MKPTKTESPTVAMVSLNVDLGRATSHGPVDPTRLPDVIATAAAYLAAASTLIADAATSFSLAYDPALAPAAGSGPRYVAVAGSKPNIAQAVGEAAGRKLDDNSFIVVFGPSFVSWQTTPELLVEVVADDLTAALQILRPVQCQGPIAKLMPFLIQIAGNVVMPETEADQAISISGRKDRAIGRAFNAIAAAHYGAASFNAMGQVVTDNPAWIPLSNMVADCAGAMAAAVSRPMSVDAAVHSIHQSVARALRECGGVKVTPFRPKAA